MKIYAKILYNILENGILFRSDNTTFKIGTYFQGMKDLFNI